MEHADSLPRAPRRPIPVWAKPLAAIFVWGAALYLLLNFFGSVKMVLLDFLAACALAAMLRPLTDRLPGPQWLRGAVVGLGFIVVVAAALAGLGWLLAKPVEKQMAQWPELRQHLDRLLESIGQRFGLHNLTVGTLLHRFAMFATGGSSGEGASPAAGVAGAATRVISHTAEFASDLGVTLALVFVGSVYLLIERRGRLTDPLIQMVPMPRRADLGGFFADLEPQLRGWLIGVLFSMAIIGVLSWLGYWIVGLQFALPLAIFAGAAEIAPNIGALTATAVTALVAATQGPGILAGVLVVHSITLFIEAHFITPLIMRRAVDIPPVVTIFSVVLWAQILGFGGLILAIPLDLLIWTALDRFVRNSHARNFVPDAPRSVPSLARGEGP
jgi:predicted PurR-regulated permease PerM